VRRVNNKTKKELIKRATEAREKAYVPYSEFPLGAALLTEDGEIFTGSNIENATYGLTNCAERTAIFKSVSEGYNNIEAVLIVSDTDKPVTPCGSCRQVISEFGGQIEVIMVTLDGKEISRQINELLPGPFKQEDME
jgi:cytidine deaminase